MPAFLSAIGYPIYRVWVTGKCWSYVPTMWWLFIGWGLFYGILAPLYLSRLFHDEMVVDYFPYGRAAGAFIIMGWAPAVILCVATWSVRKTWLLIRKGARRSS